jgi:hypothetical protein
MPKTLTGSLRHRREGRSRYCISLPNPHYRYVLSGQVGALITFPHTLVPTSLHHIILRYATPENISVADPGSGAFLTPVCGIRYLGKKSGSGSGMNNPEHISASLETNFWVKILKSFDADPGSGIFFDPGSGIRDSGWKKLASGKKTSRIRNTGK